MKSGKRLLAGIVAAMMVLSSAQLPGGVSYAQEPSPVQESMAEEAAGQEGMAGEGSAESGQSQGEKENPDGEKKPEEAEKPDGEKKPEEAEKPGGENESGEEAEKPDGEKKPEEAEKPDGENESGEEAEKPDGEEKPGEEAEKPDGENESGEEAENPEKEASEEENEETADESSVSDNDLQSEDMELMVVEEPVALPEGGVALNLDNPSCEFTALNGSKLNSGANGRPKLLIFYSNTCDNCRETIDDISSSIDKFKDRDIYALETDDGTKEDVAEFQKQYGCEEITFSHEDANQNKNGMCAYLLKVGISDAEVEMPVLCYIDANNRLQYITGGLKTADEVYSNLEKYCSYTPDAKQKSFAKAETPLIDLTPAEGNVLMGFSGAYYTETADKILKRLNAIRKEACKEGVRNPATGTPLTMDDYVPLRWSSDLEAIARLRAAEATVSQGHTRPNGQSCFTVVTKNGEQSYAENLAWNYDGLMKGIEQWYGEKNDWVKQTGGVTGHYTSIIAPYYHSVGVGAFRLSSGGWYAVAQQFSYKDGMDAEKDTSTKKCVQYMEVQGKNISMLAFSGTPTAFLEEGDSCRFSVKVTARYNDYYKNPQSFTGPYREGGSWASSDEKVAVVDPATGEVTAVGKGTAEITLSAGKKSVSTPITVYKEGESPVAVKPPKLTTYKVGQKINPAGGTVTYPSGGKPKTVSLAANMISGFDSSKPGICTVKVTVSGYATKFDTLIVEEPKLTVPAGQSLREIVLPQNAYGTYTWKDDTQAVEKAGIYTFAAEFTPKDEATFQRLSNIKVEVTAQETFGNDTDVTFKANRFTYNGAEQEPKVTVLQSGVALKEGQDYKLAYENNRNAGTAAVTVAGAGCYLGSISKTFEIQPAPLQIRAKDKTILIEAAVPAAYEYEASGLMVTDTLSKEPVITCGVTDTAAAGQYDIIPSGADAGPNYTITYENGRLTVASEYVSCTITFDMRGHGAAVAAQIGVKVGDTAKEPEEPTAEGYRFDGWYRDGACTKAWNFDTDIVQADMTLYAKWLEEGKEDGGFAYQEIADVYYTGKPCKPAVSVYDGDMLLKSGRDYRLKYYNNTNANKDGALKKGNGEGINFNPALPYVEIIGKGNYTDKIKDGNKDTVKVNFNIFRASIGDGKMPAAGVTLKVSQQLVTAKKVQKPFSSVKYVKGMKRDVDFKLHLTVENARDGSGKNLPEGLELDKAEIPAGYEGEFLLTVEGIGNYDGAVSKTIWVTDKAHLMKNASITLGKNVKNITFTGEAVKLTPAEENSPDVFTVKYGKEFLKPGRDYTVSYRNHNRVGKAELVITGNGAYVGTKTATFNIKGKAFSAKTVQVSGMENKVYTGRPLTQNAVALTYAAKDETPKALQYGTDYTISYVKNINKGRATMTFKGVEKAGYSGSFKKTFQIAAADIADTEQVKRAETMINLSVPYCKAGVKPVEEIALTNKGGFALRNGKDYTLSYKNNKAVAGISTEKPPTVTVRGKGNYAGQFDIYFQITKRGLKQAYEDGSVRVKITQVIYNPNKAEDYEYKPAVKLTDGKSALRAGTDYELSYERNTQADYKTYLDAYKQAVKNKETDIDKKLQELQPCAVITVKEESNYRADEAGEMIVVPLPIYERKLQKRDLQIAVAEAVYTGGQLMPMVTVKDTVGGKTLTEGKDYTVSYGANNKSGKNRGSVTITGIAPEYGGSVTVKFDVVKKTIAY